MELHLSNCLMVNNAGCLPRYRVNIPFGDVSKNDLDENF